MDKIRLLTLIFCSFGFIKAIFSSKAGCVEQSLVRRNNLSIPDSSYTASSHYDHRYLPHKAKLHGKYGWAARYNNNPDDYLQIDLGTPRVITAVATQGNGGDPDNKHHAITYEWVTRYRLNYSDDSSNWISYKIFDGNVDSNGEKHHDLSQNPITTRYIRFVPLTFQKHKTMRVDIVVAYQEAPVFTAIPHQRSIQISWTIQQCNPTGPITGFVIRNGSKDLPVSSSERQYTLTGLRPYTDYNVTVLAIPQQGNEVGSDTKTIKTSIAVPSAPVYVTGTLIPPHDSGGPRVVITWDRPSEPNGIIRKYTIVYYYNMDTLDNKTVTIGGSANLTYSINVSRNGMMSYKISATTNKEGPYTASKDIAYGCVEQSLVGRNNLNIPDSSYTASSYFDPRYKPHNAKLYGKYGWAPRNNNNPDDYLQIDLGTLLVIIAVATQGSGITKNNEWVIKYKMYLATNKKNQSYYTDEFGNVKLFKGNTDSNSVVRHDLMNPRLARYIRFVPVEYHNYKTMRVNVYVSNQEPPRLTGTPKKRSIKLTWTYRKCSPTDYITGYLLKFGNIIHRVIGDDQSYNVTNLKPHTENDVSIKVTKQVGYGIWSNVTTIRTAIAEPESITSLNATETSSETILLKWKSELIHGPLKGYRITYTPLGGKTKTFDVGDLTTYTLASLLKYTNYSITIAVRNTKYISPPSQEQRVRTMDDAPSAPVNLKATLIHLQDSVTLRVVITWNRPRDPNGIIRKFTIVYYYNKDESKKTIVTINGANDLKYAIDTTRKGMLSYNVSATTIEEGSYAAGEILLLHRHPSTYSTTT